MLREISSGAQEKTEEAVRNCCTKIESKMNKEKAKDAHLDDNPLNYI